jgi:hypothetical protein
MTSTEFAAKYRLLKNVATHGARSFLAQQVELGRMVMVHYLDSENVEERAATLSRLDALRPPGRDKLLEVADVDGTPVAVTLFISSFKDFSAWLDAVGAPTTPSNASVASPGEFTRVFSKVEPPVKPVIPNAGLEAARAPEMPRKAPGEFTRIFGKVDEAALAPAEPAPATVPPQDRDEETIPTVIMEAVKPPHAPPVSDTVNSEPAQASDSGSSFTAIFGALSNPTPANEFPAPPIPLHSIPPQSPVTAPVTPPAPPAFDPRPALPSAAPQAAAPHQPGEFTQLFQRLSPGVGTTPPVAGAPLLAPDVPRPLDPTPRADFALPSTPAPVSSFGAPSLGRPPLGAPSLGAASLGAVPAPKLPDLGTPPNGSGASTVPPVLPPIPAPPAAPRSWGTPATPPPIGASVFGNSGPSEFTRILSPIAAPPPPPVPIQPPASPAQGAAGASAKKSMLPLIIGLVSVVVLTIVMVVYFVVRR